MSGRESAAGEAPAPVRMRSARLEDLRDRSTVSRMLAAYLLQTEREKGAEVTHASALPARYRLEVEDPASALRGCDVILAQLEDTDVGMAVVTAPARHRSEIKRLWTEPEARRQGVGRALVESCVERAAQRGAHAVELTVWQWRTGAIAVYERAGFAQVESWDPRPGLVCLRRTLVPGAPSAPGTSQANGPLNVRD